MGTLLIWFFGLALAATLATNLFAAVFGFRFKAKPRRETDRERIAREVIAREVIAHRADRKASRPLPQPSDRPLRQG